MRCRTLSKLFAYDLLGRQGIVFAARGSRRPPARGSGKTRSRLAEFAALAEPRGHPDRHQPAGAFGGKAPRLNIRQVCLAR